MKQQLADRGLQPEAWGGRYGVRRCVGEEADQPRPAGGDDLPGGRPRQPEGYAGAAGRGHGDRSEAGSRTRRGGVVLVQNGTLRTGDSYIVGNTFGKIRAMFNDRGQPIAEAGPSTPVEILGLEGMPDAGDTFLVMADRDKAKGIAQYRKMKEREAQLAKSSSVSLEGLAEQIKQAGMKDLNLIVKGDVQGSVEVIAEDLQRMSTEKVRVRVLHSGVGAITESDVLLASASNAVIIGFNVRPDRKSEEVAERENVEIRLHSIIYELQRRDHQGDVRTAGAGVQGELRGQGRGDERLQDHEGRADRRLPRDRGLITRDGAGARDARGRRGLARQDRLAEALQGRCVRGAAGRGVRHRPGRVQGYPRGRRD